MSKRILIAPLDWGLGHATRCIPLIQYLLQTNHQPIIAASGRPLELLRAEFPTAEFYEFEGYNISYPEGTGMIWKMFKSTPHILKRIRSEEEEIDALVDELKLDAVISDNRFGLSTEKVPCVYMTHQVMIKAPFLETTLYRLHIKYMRKFNQVWIPDYAENGISGDLSHKFPIPFNGRFIGALSRFNTENQEKSTDVLILVSGPEPQRTKFEKLVLSQAKTFRGNVVAVLGVPDKTFDRKEGNVRCVSHLTAKELQSEIAKAKLVISRSGYSTVMDLAAMGKKAVFVPTPGQTEQEYLAQKFTNDRLHYSVTQRKFDLQNAVNQSENYRGFEAQNSEEYKLAIDELITSIS